jgi:F420-dependent oxidoreductase-like protein
MSAGTLPPLGVIPPRGTGRTPTALRAWVQWVDALGYHSFWLGESWGMESFGTLGWLAAQTRRIQLGTGIVNVFSRSPALIGQAAATLDALTGGRFILGLGTSGPRVIEHWHGLPNTRPLRRLREYVEIVRLVTAGQRVDYAGEIFRLQGFTLDFAPIRPRLPIYVAALAPASIRQVGELADGWMPVFLCQAAIGRFRTLLAEGAQRAGREARSVTIMPYVWVLVTDDVPAARSAIRAQIVHYLCRMGTHYPRHLMAQGFTEEVTAVQKAYAVDRSQAAAAVSDRLVEELAIIGTAAQCRERLLALCAAGVDRPILFFPTDVPEAIWRATVAALAP